MTADAVLWSLAYLALGLVLAVVLLSCMAAMLVLFAGVRECHRQGKTRLAQDAETQAWQRIVAANRDIDVELS